MIVLGLLVVGGAAVVHNQGRDPGFVPSPMTVETRVKVDLAQPFAGTPAAGWSDGEAGILMPPATEMNGFSAQKATEALTAARKAFIAAYLDRQVIQDGNVELLAALFAPDIRAEERADTTNRVRIAPPFKLLPVSPKVTGTMTVESGEKGELNIRAGYSVAYAFAIDDPAEIRDAMDIVSVVRVDKRYVFRDGDTFEAGSQGLWPGDGSVILFYSIACKPLEQDLLAPAYSERAYGGADTSDEDRAKIFDPSKPMPTTKGNC
ncbi:hypothetical protein [Kibdelosporangium aridum]|uniref:hypothetical protein n=1 Tax=Kibdelosporangium aridum TaxID=2030 RepID=UPI001179E064|nr:hypothetical protein [Kibdelosporangium aridum]